MHFNKKKVQQLFYSGTSKKSTATNDKLKKNRKVFCQHEAA